MEIVRYGSSLTKRFVQISGNRNAMNHLEHPLKVYNSAAGIHFLLQWWSHNEQNRVIVARSEKALHSVFKHICHENPDDGRVNRVLEVEFVAPSDEMCQHAIGYNRREDIRLFIDTVILELQKFSALDKPLPKQFQRCTVYSPSPDYVSEGESPSESTIEDHYECLNCFNSITLVGYTPESLYNKYHDAWLQSDPIKRRSTEDKFATYSLARQARNDEEIWVAYPDFGPHSKGVALSVIGVYPINTVLFYFRMIRELDSTPWQAQISEARNRFDERKRVEKVAWKATFKARQLANINRILKIFNEENDECTD